MKPEIRSCEERPTKVVHCKKERYADIRFCECCGMAAEFKRFGYACGEHNSVRIPLCVDCASNKCKNGSPISQPCGKTGKKREVKEYPLEKTPIIENVVEQRGAGKCIPAAEVLKAIDEEIEGIRLDGFKEAIHNLKNIKRRLGI